MEKKVQEKIDKIDALPVPDVKEAGNFKTATLRYFRYIKSIYTVYVKTGKSADRRNKASRYK
ncbi:MAG: hypothetical protein WDO16_13115 [Bacteroidota bacterium]